MPKGAFKMEEKINQESIQALKQNQLKLYTRLHAVLVQHRYTQAYI